MKASVGGIAFNFGIVEYNFDTRKFYVGKIDQISAGSKIKSANFAFNDGNFTYLLVNFIMITIKNYVSCFTDCFNEYRDTLPWNFVADISTSILTVIAGLKDDYVITNKIAIHKTAIVEAGAVLKGPLIVSANCFVAAHAYLRGGVYIGNNTIIGPGCEIKSSAIFNHTSIAHFNFIGDSIIGSYVNFEAGSIVANHYNERVDKSITIAADGISQTISPTKFGALVGNHSKIGANAVLSPGTILKPNSVIKRLELIDQARA